MNEQLKPCLCGKKAKIISRIATSFVECQSCGIRTKTFSGRNDGLSFSSDEAERLATESWNNRADKWIEVDGAKNIPIGDWMVATCDKELKVATHIAKCRPNVIVIGGHFHFDMPNVYAYKEIGELPIPPKAASCGE